MAKKKETQFVGVPLMRGEEIKELAEKNKAAMADAIRAQSPGMVKFVEKEPDFTTPVASAVEAIASSMDPATEELVGTNPLTTPMVSETTIVVPMTVDEMLAAVDERLARAKVLMAEYKATERNQVLRYYDIGVEIMETHALWPKNRPGWQQKVEERFGPYSSARQAELCALNLTREQAATYDRIGKLKVAGKALKEVIEIPAEDEDEDIADQTPEDYFRTVKGAIQAGDNWELTLNCGHEIAVTYTDGDGSPNEVKCYLCEQGEPVDEEDDTPKTEEAAAQAIATTGAKRPTRRHRGTSGPKNPKKPKKIRLKKHVFTKEEETAWAVAIEKARTSKKPYPHEIMLQVLASEMEEDDLDDHQPPKVAQAP